MEEVRVVALDVRTTTYRWWHMMKELDEVRRLVAMHGDDLPFALDDSGGKDSTRMLGMIRSEFPNPSYPCGHRRHRSRACVADLSC
jgi:hypothetical protein